MKNSKYNIVILLALSILLLVNKASAQAEYSIKGKLINEGEQPVMFAHVALLSSMDSSIIAGTVSDESGNFSLIYNNQGKYLLSATFVGFDNYMKEIEISGGSGQNIDLGNIILKSKQIELEEIVVRAERLKARQHVDKITYYVNSAMKATSNTGIDMIRHIPGIKVDLLQNVSLNGSQDILILVEGIKRDADYLARINPDKIDRIELKETPGAQYDAGVDGVIDIILKKDENKGVDGHVYLNIPTAGDEVFSFPTAGINFAFDKLTLYTSYNGAFSFFDVKTEDKRVFSSAGNSGEVTSNESLSQRNWSQKLHFGLDYFHNDNSRLNIYGFISLFSNNQRGSLLLAEDFEETGNEVNNYNKTDYDINSSAFTSIYYEHIFGNGEELSFEADFYSLQSDVTLNLVDVDNRTEYMSNSKPGEKSFSTRLDLSIPMKKQLVLRAGISQRLKYTNDELLPGYRHSESASSVHMSVSYSNGKLQGNAGLRAEYLQYGSEDQPVRNELLAIPALSLKYSLNSGSQFLFSYKKGINRPNVFQLNPHLMISDPVLTQKGNSELEPEIKHELNLGYSWTFGSSFVRTGVFYSHRKDVFEYLTIPGDDLSLEKEMQNLGSLHNSGIRASGSLKLHSRITINPYFEILYAQTNPNKLAHNNQINDRKAINYKTALSAMILLQDDLSFSLSASYGSPNTGIQNDYHEDILYFVSLEKTFFGRLKAGITSAIPFKKKFTYQGYNIAGNGFEQTIKKDIRVSFFPVWLKLRYSFSSGRKATRIKRDISFEENRPKKGF